ncbi:MAG: transporter substrate-binding domain-containing protein [Candidatus Auribacterota bacterium]|nr:transporter substrate-binding domain-containing protein [Candidatus Auribacterota bacterium]
MKIIRSFILLFCISILLAGCGGSNLQSVSEESILVGVCPNYPPMIFKEEGRITGLEADMARELGRELNKTVEFIELDWDDLIPALIAGRVDVIMSGMSVTNERFREIRFLPHYMRIGQMALIRKSDIEYFAHPEAIYRIGARAGFESGTTGENFVREMMPRSVPVPLTSPEEGYQALLADRIDVFIHDGPTIWRVAEEKMDQGLMGLYRPLTEEYLAWAVRRGDQTLYREFSSILEKWKESGYLQTQINHWIRVRIEVER